MKFILILIFMLSFPLYAQTWHMKRTIPYSNPDPLTISGLSDFISFAKSLNEGRLPLYSELIPPPLAVDNLKLYITRTVYEEFKGVPMQEIPADSAWFDYSLEYMKKQAFIQFSLLPFRMNPETGKFERLKSFVIRLEAKPAEANSEIHLKKSVLKEESVLSKGLWYRIRTGESGIYKLSYEQISSMNIGDPSKIRIYGYSGEVLPEDSRQGEKDDLIPVQIYLNQGNDGIFNAGDFILFYAKGSVTWYYDAAWGMLRHRLNPYSDDSYYFLTAGTGPDLPDKDPIPDKNPDYFINSYDYRVYHEKELENMLLSGKQWYGEYFGLTQQQSFTFEVPDIISDRQVEIFTTVMAKALDSSYFHLSYNNEVLATLAVQKANLSDYTSTFGFVAQEKASFKPLSGSLSLRLRYTKPDASAKGWLDYITLNARSSLRMNDSFLEFRDLDGLSQDAVTEFTLSDAGPNTLIWDVSDQNNILEISSSLTGSDLKFRVETSKLREFVAFNTIGNFQSPVIRGEDVGPVDNQNLHGPAQPDMVIITWPDFREEAERLASYRRENDGLDVIVVEPKTIFNEFSSGKPDISAYRNYLKMLYERAGNDSHLLPSYLLLFGDGSFDNKGIMENAGNYILTFQSDNSLSPTSSYVSDDFFGLLDPGESMITGLLDIGVGRLPASDPESAKILVDKIVDYERPDRMGDWRNTICFIGDDEDSNIHMQDADAMAEFVEDHYPGFNFNKIYLDAYKQVATPSGQRYPDVNRAINEQIEKGSLILNYTGHGGTKGWAHELILGVNDIEGWNNSRKLPLFMTATCEFSRYDDHLLTSAGEKVLLNPGGGGIALLTTTRLVYSQPNRVLNEKFYEIVFEKDNEGHNYRLGDIMQYTKNQAGSGINKRNFTLLGDPSLRLSYPELFVSADSLNGSAVTGAIDTLQALKKITVTGHVTNIKGETMDGFNGFIYPTVYDKVVLQQTLANDGGSKKTFRIRNNILYKGKSTVRNGFFSFSFIVPKDINYAYGPGRLSFYAQDSLTDAAGAFDGIIIGGTSTDAETDNTGPLVNVFMNNSAFRSGGITNSDPVLFVEVEDQSGVNTTGSGIGHDITAILDGDSKNSFLLNDYYQAHTDNYQGGVIRYPMNDLEPGYHSISVTLWDVYNNTGSGSTDFIVVLEEEFFLDDLLNYPNPFSEYTRISFSHNKPGTGLDIKVDIFTTEGQIVASLKAREDESGFRSGDIYWDGQGAVEGQSVYLYRISATTTDGEKAEKSGKLILIK